MTDPTEIARVAAGLTRAQREAVESAKQIFGSLVLAGQPSARQALKRKGLTDGPFADRFTELGLLVRDHILREKSGG